MHHHHRPFLLPSLSSAHFIVIWFSARRSLRNFLTMGWTSWTRARVANELQRETSAVKLPPCWCQGLPLHGCESGCILAVTIVWNSTSLSMNISWSRSPLGSLYYGPLKCVTSLVFRNAWYAGWYMRLKEIERRDASHSVWSTVQILSQISGEPLVFTSSVTILLSYLISPCT